MGLRARTSEVDDQQMDKWQHGKVGTIELGNAGNWTHGQMAIISIQKIRGISKTIARLLSLLLGGRAACCHN